MMAYRNERKLLLGLKRAQRDLWCIAKEVIETKKRK